MAPMLKDFRVPLGRWRPATTTDFEDDRIPPGHLLKNSKFWTDSARFGHIHALLQTPPVKVDVSTADDHVKMDLQGTTSSIILINSRPGGGMPLSIGSLPVRVMVIDARGMSVEEGRMMDRLPGRSRYNTVPIFVIGGVREVEEAVRCIRRSTGESWSGHTRNFEVITAEPNPHFLATRRRLCVLAPDTVVLSKWYPILDITSAVDPNYGWMTAIGLMASVWRQQAVDDAVRGADSAEWMQVVSDQPALSAQIATRLGGTPSVIHCPLHEVSSLEDLSDTMRTFLGGAESFPPVSWIDARIRWAEHLPIFVKQAVGTHVEEVSSEEDNEPRAPSPAPPTPPAPKPKPKARPRTPRKSSKPKPKPPPESPAEAPAAEALHPAEGRRRSRTRTPSPRSARESSSDESSRKRRRPSPSERDRELRQKQEAERERRQKEYIERRERIKREVAERGREREERIEREKEREKQRGRESEREREDRRRREEDRERDRERLREEERRKRFRHDSEERRADARRRDEERRGAREHQVVRRESQPSSSATSSRRPMDEGGVRRTLGPHRRR